MRLKVFSKAVDLRIIYANDIAKPRALGPQEDPAPIMAIAPQDMVAGFINAAMPVGPALYGRNGGLLFKRRSFAPVDQGDGSSFAGQ